MTQWNRGKDKTLAHNDTAVEKSQYAASIIAVLRMELGAPLKNDGSSKRGGKDHGARQLWLLIINSYYVEQRVSECRRA